MNRLNKNIVNFIKYGVNPFPKCDLFKLEQTTLLCCENNEKCPLNLPKRTACTNDPCCRTGSNIPEWCFNNEYEYKKI